MPSKQAQTIANPNVTPYSLEAEQSVLGALMLDNKSFERIADRVIEADFYRPEHRIVFRTIVELVEKNTPADIVTVTESLQSNHLLEKVGGESYLYTLAEATPTITNIIAYADIVRDRAILREILESVQGIAESVYQTKGRSSHDIINEAESLIFQIGQRRESSAGPMPLKDILSRATDRIDVLHRSDSGITGEPTGFADLDEMTSGLQPGDLIIVAGRPSMGKTSFAMNMAENIAVSEKKSVLVFSMEMPSEMLAMRMLSSLGRIDQHKVRTGKLSDDDWPRIASAVGMLSETKMFIDDTAALNPVELCARVRRLAREHKDLGLVIVDYIQLMRVSGFTENRTLEISEISRSLKILAKEVNVPIVVLSQLNRSLEQRQDRRPIMSDIRESGAIEQDADLIMFIYRDEVYNPDTPDRNMAEIIIAKQRNGPIGKISLTFLGQYTRFENYIDNSEGILEGAAN